MNRLRQEPEQQAAKLPPSELLLIDENVVAELLSIRPSSVRNLEKNDPTFPKPVNWKVDRRVWRRADVTAYVEQLQVR